MVTQDSMEAFNGYIFLWLNYKWFLKTFTCNYEINAPMCIEVFKVNTAINHRNVLVMLYRLYSLMSRQYLSEIKRIKTKNVMTHACRAVNVGF